LAKKVGKSVWVLAVQQVFKVIIRNKNSPGRYLRRKDYIPEKDIIGRLQEILINATL
jgi:hypothetical protein